MELRIGDIVETNYKHASNTIGKVIAIHKNFATIIGMEGEVSHHKKMFLTIVTN